MANDKMYKRSLKVYIDGKEVENSVAGIQREMRKLRGEMKNLTIGTEEYEKKAAEMRKLDGILRQHRQNVSSVANEQDRMTDAIKNALGLNSKFANSIMGLTANGNGLKGMLAGATQAVGSFGKALLALLANPVVLGIAGIAGAGAAFKWFYDYNQGISKATELTREFLGLTGSELQSVRSEIQAIADGWGKDYKTVLQAVDNLTSTYGLTAGEAMDIIKDGFQAGADEGGKFLGLLSQYSGSFKDAGISAKELVGYITQTRSGIFSEGGMALIQMASKKIREMTDATKSALEGIGIDADDMQRKLANGQLSMADAIKQVSAQLTTVGTNSQAAGKVLSDVFGRQGAAAGQTMIKFLSEMVTDMEELKKVTGEDDAIIRQQVESQAELNRVTSALFDVTGKGWRETILSLKLIATQWLVAVAKRTVDVANYFIDWYNESLLVRGTIQTITVVIRNLWAVAKVVFNGIVDAVKLAGRELKAIGDILEGIITFNYDKVAKGFEGLGMGIVNSLKESFGDAKAFGSEIASNTVAGFNQALGKQKLNHIVIPYETTTLPEVSVTETAPKGNDTTTNKKEGKDNNKEIEAERKRLQEALTNIDAEYLAKQNDLRRRYMDGEIKDKREMETQLEALELEKLNKQLAVAGIEPAKREEIAEKIISLQMKLREKLEDVMKSIDENEGETLDRQLSKITKKYDDESAILKKSLDNRLISQENYQEAYKRLTEQFNKDKQKAIEEDAAKQLAIIEAFHERELLALEDRRIRERMTDEQYEEEKRNMSKQWIEQALEDLQLSEEQRIELIKKYLEIEQEERKEMFEKYKSAQQALQAATETLTNETMRSLGEALGNMIQGEENAMRDLLKQSLLLIVDYLEKKLIAVQVSKLLEAALASTITFGAAAAKAAAETALIQAAFAAAKGLISSFDIGGFTGNGEWNEPRGIVHAGEFVANRHAVRNPSVLPVLSVIDQAQRTGTIANLTASDIAAVLPTRTTVSPIVPTVSGDNAQRIDNRELLAMLSTVNRTMSAVIMRFKDPIRAETYATGKHGTIEAEGLVQRMRNNVTRTKH